jgi:hypothetical protein
MFIAVLEQRECSVVGIKHYLFVSRRQARPSNIRL